MSDMCRSQPRSPISPLVLFLAMIARLLKEQTGSPMGGLGDKFRMVLEELRKSQERPFVLTLPLLAPFFKTGLCWADLVNGRQRSKIVLGGTPKEQNCARSNMTHGYLGDTSSSVKEIFSRMQDTKS